MKREAKRLILSKDTIHRLDPTSLRAVRGGEDPGAIESGQGRSCVSCGCTDKCHTGDYTICGGVNSAIEGGCI
jgi:hypothetical protein